MKCENPLNKISESQWEKVGWTIIGVSLTGLGLVVSVASEDDPGVDCGPYRGVKAEVKKIKPAIPSEGKAEKSRNYKAVISQNSNKNSSSSCDNVDVNICPSDAEVLNRNLAKGNTTIDQLGDIMLRDCSNKSKLHSK